MKHINHNFKLYTLFLCICCMNSCSNELITDNHIKPEVKKPYRVVIDLNEGNESRIALSQDINSIKSVWEEGDEFLLRYNDNGKLSGQYTFKLEDGAGSSKGTFVCNYTPIHKEGRTYRIYYPSSITNNIDFNEQVSLRNQVQDGDGSTTHLAERLTMRHTVGHFSDIRFIDSDYTTRIYDETKGDYIELTTSASNLQKSTIIKIEASNIPVDFQPVSLELKIAGSDYITFYDTNNTYSDMEGLYHKTSLELNNFDKDKNITAYTVQSYKDFIIPSGATLRLIITDSEGVSYYSDKYFETNNTIPGGKLLTLKYSDNWEIGNNSQYFSKDFSYDGQIVTLQSASVPNGINIVFMGDGFSDRQISNNTYDKVMKQGFETFFSEEPFKSFRHFFNVYYVIAVSKQEGCLDNALKTSPNQTSFETYFGAGTVIGGNDELVQTYTRKVPTLKDIRKDDLTSIVLMNSIRQSGTCYMTIPWPAEGYKNKPGYSQGYSIAYIPINVSNKGLRDILIHEAAGHGFGKLCDEYSIGIPKDLSKYHPYEWFFNVDETNDPTQILWKEFFIDSYINKEGIGAYEGANSWSSGYYRPTYSSIMRSIPNSKFNAPSRKAIYVRMHKLVYGEDWTWEDHKDEFFEWDAKFGMPNEPSTPEDEIMDSRLYNHDDTKNVMLKLPPSPPVIINPQIP